MGSAVGDREQAGERDERRVGGVGGGGGGGSGLGFVLLSVCARVCLLAMLCAVNISEIEQG